MRWKKCRQNKNPKLIHCTCVPYGEVYKSPRKCAMEKKNGSNLTVLKKIRHERTLLITLAHNQCNKRKLVYNKIIESDLLAISKMEKGL